MRQNSIPLRVGTALGLAALAAAPAQAQEGIVFGSQTTLIGEADPVTGEQTILGACGGIVSAVAVDDQQITISTTTGALYRKLASESFVSFWEQSPNDGTALTSVGGFLLVGGSDGTIQRYDYDQPGTTLLATLSFGGVEALAVHEWQLFVAGPFGSLFVGDPLFGALQPLSACTGDITAMVGFSDGPQDLLYIATADGSLWTFDIQTKSFTDFITLPQPATGLGVFGSDLVVGSADGIARRIQRQTGVVKQEYAVGVSIDALGMQPPAHFSNVATFCSGSVCPCANDDADHSCATSQGWGTGAVFQGSTSVAADDLSIRVYDLPPNVVGRFYMGLGNISVPFGDGKICVGNGGYSSFRFPVVNTGPDGVLELGPGIVGFADANFELGLISAGELWNFQGWFRDAAGPCGSTVNTTQAFAVGFTQ
jgi:WD40 repeat protein